MAITTMSSREFNQDLARAKRSAKKGPVIITDRGRPSFVLLTVSEYEKITRQEPDSSQGKSLADALRMPDGSPDFDFDFPKMNLELGPADLD